MPLDPTIASSLRPFQGVNILAIQENQRRQEQEARLAEQDKFEQEKYKAAREEFAQQQTEKKALGEAYQSAGGDRQELLNQMAQRGLGHRIPDVIKQFNELDQSSLSLEKTQAEIDKLKRDREDAQKHGVGQLGALIEALGNDQNAWETGRNIMRASNGQWGTEEELAPYDQAIAADPSKIAAITAVMQKKAGVAPKEPKTREVTTVNDKGEKVTRIVADVPGQEFPVAPPTPKEVGEAKLGSAEDFMLRYAKEKGKTPDQLSVQEVSEGMRRFNALNDQPKSVGSGGGKLTRVEHKDPDTGQTVIEYLTDAQIRGQKFQKGDSATVQNRLMSADAVNKTGEDIISKLNDPAYRNKLGPVMGRFSTLEDFLGNPPPEYSELAGQIESLSLANMGVHGMRNAEMAKDIRDKLLGRRHTPESLIAAIRGLNAFSRILLQSEGRPTSGGQSAAPQAGGGGVDPDLAAYRARKKK